MEGRERIPYPFPDLPVLQKSDVATIFEMDMVLFKLLAHETECVLKTVCRSSEGVYNTEKLAEAANLNSLIGVMDAGDELIDETLSRQYCWKGADQGRK